MVLMAIDHVRVYSGVPAGVPTAGLFFTRWVTHFCAPAFVFLAGTSAWLYGRRHADLSRFLLTRGFWLILLELTFLRVAWSFHFDLSSLLMAGVIWAIGWSMIALSGLSRLPLRAVAAFGLIVVFAHNLLDGPVQGWLPTLDEHALSWLWKILYVGFFAGPIQLGEDSYLIVLYSLVPWVGVMACGYAFAPLLTREPARRNRICWSIGLGAIALFALLRGFNLYGDPRPWDGSRGPALFAFLNASKYPASLSFLLMTLGPTIAAIPFFEAARGRWVEPLRLFGRVPFFFYMLHIPLIHLLAVGVSLLRSGAVEPWLIGDHPMNPPEQPEGYQWSLGLLYLVWTLAIGLLYAACRWFARRKARATSRWWSYL